MALSTYAGQNYGAGRVERVREGLKDGMLVMAAFSVAMFVVMRLIGTNIVMAFVDESDVIELGVRGLQLTSCFYIFLGTIFAIRGALNGVGDALFSLINGVIEVLCRILLPMILMLLPGADVEIIWWTAGLTWAISALACALRYFAWRARRARAELRTA